MNVKCDKFLKLLVINVCLLGTEIFSFQSFARSRDFLFSLPLITMGREGVTKAEFNLMSQGSIGIEWSLIPEGEELQEKELEENPNNSLSSQGQEFGLTYSRFSDPDNMSGFFWAMGAGFRRIAAKWRKDPTEETAETAQVLDAAGKVNHNLDVSGTTLTWRVGYRYIGKEWGVVAGVYLGVKHFQNRVSDVGDDNDDTGTTYSAIAQQDKLALKRRLMSSFQPGIELGWAF